jgi:hypothetical protein
MTAMNNNCLNCKQLLTGEYCTHCGQRERGREVRVRDVAGDALEDMSSLDSRLWRTLAGLLFRPGLVTAEYLAGRRASFVPPLRFYFIVSFLVFLVVAAMPPGSAVEPGQQGVMITFDDDGQDSKSLSEALEEAEIGQSLSQEGYDFPPWLAPYEDQLKANAAAIEDNPEVFLALLVQRLPQMMFVLLPLFALLLQLNYLFSPFHYLQHLIFSLHFHSFAFLLYLLQWLIGLLRPGNYTGWIVVALLIYLPLALRRVYHSGALGAIGKSLVINVSYLLMVGLAGVAYILINLALL